MSNNTDSRSVHTDALAVLGTILEPNEPRDAIHLAVIGVEAGMNFYPGSHISLGEDGKAYVAEKNEGLGIADPFLTEMIETGQWCFLIIYPRQITSLRHVWEHPAFDSIEDVSDSPQDTIQKVVEAEQWIRNWLYDHGDNPGFDAVIATAVNGEWYDGPAQGSFAGIHDGEYLHFSGTDAHGSIPPEFWDKLEIYTGQKFHPDQRAEYFSCSC